MERQDDCNLMDGLQQDLLVHIHREQRRSLLVEHSVK